MRNGSLCGCSLRSVASSPRHYRQRSLEEALRIQMAFVHSQLNVWRRQATDLASLYTKAVEDAAKERSGGNKSWSRLSDTDQGSRFASVLLIAANLDRV